LVIRFVSSSFRGVLSKEIFLIKKNRFVCFLKGSLIPLGWDKGLECVLEIVTVREKEIPHPAEQDSG